jgi:Cu2+-exporting ATPase
MSNATPHQHGHETDAHAGHGSPEEHGKASVEHRSHDQHEGHSPSMFRDKFWLSLALTVPVVFWSAHIQELL